MDDSELMTNREPESLDMVMGNGGVGIGSRKVIPGMSCVDTSHDERIPVLMEMVESLSRATDPASVLRAFAWGLEELYGHRSFVSLSTRGLGLGEYKITRMVLDNEKEGFDTDPWSNSDQMPVHQGGFLAELISQPYPELILNLNIPNDPVMGDVLAPYGSLMAIPLFDQGEALNWGIMLDRDPQGFSIEQLEQTILRFNMVGGRVKATLIANELSKAHDQIREDMDRIAAIQRALLPSVMPKIPGLTLAARYETFDLAGGDYYDFIPLPAKHDNSEAGKTSDSATDVIETTGSWIMVVADVSGHGPAAAVIMAMLHAILHAFPHPPEGPGEVLEHLNRHLCAKRIESSFVTAFLAIYEPVSRRFTYARAGHNPPLLKEAGSGGTVNRLEGKGGVPLGIIEDASYSDTEVTLQEKQTIILYTDGITEAKDPTGEMFGVEGIEEALTKCTGDPECVMGSIMGAVRAFESGLRPTDDQTMMAMQAVGEVISE